MFLPPSLRDDLGVEAVFRSLFVVHAVVEDEDSSLAWVELVKHRQRVVLHLFDKILAPPPAIVVDARLMSLCVNSPWQAHKNPETYMISALLNTFSSNTIP